VSQACGLPPWFSSAACKKVRGIPPFHVLGPVLIATRTAQFYPQAGVGLGHFDGVGGR
jgi:hypothetical protein